MNIAILNTQVPFCSGGAEVLAFDLQRELEIRGHRCALVTLPFKWFPQTSLMNAIASAGLLELDEANGVPIDRVIALKFPLWLAPHKQMSVWILHQHRTAYDLWDSEHSDIRAMENPEEIRSLIHGLDNRALSTVSSLCAISRTVADRLNAFNGLSADVIYPPPRDMGKYCCESDEGFLFFPSRINPIKRQSLVIEALALVSKPVRVVFAGIADQPAYEAGLRSRAEELGVADRVEWLGWIDEQQKRDYYSRCRAVLFPTYDEDYGYVTPEAMLSSKPVITCGDSGGPTEFLETEDMGIVTLPDAESLARAIDKVSGDGSWAVKAGANARAHVVSMDLSWDKVVDALL